VIGVVLAVAGAFSNGDEDDGTTTTASGPAPQAEEQPAPPAGEQRPEVTTVDVGGRPTAVSAGRDGVWIADSFSRRATMLRSGSANAKPVSLALEGPASDVTATGDGAWFALPEQQAVERRDATDPAPTHEVVEVDGFPSAIAADGGAVYALSERAVEAIDADSGEAVDSFDVGGFASGLAVDDGTLWVVVDNREVVRVDADTGDVQSEPVDAREPFGVAAAEGVAFVVGATGEVTRVDPEGGDATAIRVAVKGALDIAVGDDVVWVTSSRRTVTRFDAGTLKPIGEPLRVGDEPASVAVGDDAVWVANGGDGTLSRIEP
jgi:DNA-binding beta-propeller fold protein YncE